MEVNMDKEKTLLNAVLGFPISIDGNQVLLAIKKEKIGKGCWNGYGGGIKGNERPERAMIRELREESGAVISSEDLRKAVVVDFHNLKGSGSEFICRVHVYFIVSWRGLFMETKEMGRPRWFDVDSLPLDDMLPADRYWLPLLLQRKRLKRVEAWYGPFQKELLKPIFIEYA